MIYQIKNKLYIEIIYNYPTPGLINDFDQFYVFFDF